MRQLHGILKKYMKKECHNCRTCHRNFCHPERGGTNGDSRSFFLPAGPAPQSFYLKDILSIHRKNKENGNITFIDSCSMMSYFGYKMATIEGPMENIKITTPTDYFIFRAMVEVHENQQIFGF